MKKTWIKILCIYILHMLSFFVDYSFLYTNAKVAFIWEWINPALLFQFLIIGMIGCVCFCKQRLKEFSSNIFSIESLIVLLVNIIFILFITFVGKMIGNYEINWLGVLCCSVYCYVFVGITEEWIYRGFIITQMKKVINNRVMIVIISAMLFSLMHLPSYVVYTENITFGGIVYRLLIPLLIGLVFAHIYLCNGNLFALILIHGSYDLIENVTFDSWYYWSYGICWILIIGYAVYCNKKKDKMLSK